jgi:hypothetical protein
MLLLDPVQDARTEHVGMPRARAEPRSFSLGGSPGQSQRQWTGEGLVDRGGPDRDVRFVGITYRGRISGSPWGGRPHVVVPPTSEY